MSHAFETNIKAHHGISIYKAYKYTNLHVILKLKNHTPKKGFTLH